MRYTRRKSGSSLAALLRRRLPRMLLAGALAAAAAAPAAKPVVPGLQAHASGVFLNPAGDLLTAWHAVADCGTLYALKDAQVVRAELIAHDAALDLAVLRTTFKPYLSAVFPATTERIPPSQPVFAESYDVLQRMPRRGHTLFNAMTTPAEGELSLISGVRPGASGSPVLGASGLVLGVVVARLSTDGAPSGRVPLSHARRAGISDATRVKAVSANSISAFLQRHGIEHVRSDDPQLGPMQAQAPRAATLSAGVICG